MADDLRLLTILPKGFLANNAKRNLLLPGHEKVRYHIMEHALINAAINYIWYPLACIYTHPKYKKHFTDKVIFKPVYYINSKYVLSSVYIIIRGIFPNFHPPL